MGGARRFFRQTGRTMPPATADKPDATRIDRIQKDHDNLASEVHDLRDEFAGLKQRSTLIIGLLSLIVTIGLWIGKLQYDQGMALVELGTNRNRDAADAARRDHAISNLTDAVNELVRKQQ